MTDLAHDPIGTPGQPWGAAERAQWRARQVRQRSYADDVLAVVERLRGMPAIRELRSAVIWVKAASSYSPDYHVESLPTSPWIHQPFEEYDHMRPGDLKARWG